jgi:hypothetical protein
MASSTLSKAMKSRSGPSSISDAILSGFANTWGNDAPAIAGKHPLSWIKITLAVLAAIAVVLVA